MKRTIIICALAALALASSCRKEADFVANPYLYEYTGSIDMTYSHQFESVWQGINSGYAFWDIETVDWDGRYEEFSARLQKMTGSSEDGSISDKDLQQFYEELCGDLCDHHMAVIIKNLTTGTKFMVTPGQNEVQKREYYHDALTLEDIDKNLETLNASYSVSDYAFASCSEATVLSCVINLADGRIIPYLWQSGYAMSAILPYLEQYDPDSEQETAMHLAAQVIDSYFTTITEANYGRLAGIILDNRSNTGGIVGDKELVIGTYLKEQTAILETRSKNGAGRLDFSPWAPIYSWPNEVYSRDITTEDIPYVILQDINSISMGELSGLGARHALPTAYIIGENSFGGQGTLTPSLTNILSYGTFGDNQDTEGHYVYTVTYATRAPGGEILEGKGSTPDKEVLATKDGTFAQLLEAVEYIRKY